MGIISPSPSGFIIEWGEAKMVFLPLLDPLLFGSLPWCDYRLKKSSTFEPTPWGKTFKEWYAAEMCFSGFDLDAPEIAGAVATRSNSLYPGEEL